MKVHTNYLNAVILFALAFLLAAATGPVAAQQPGPPDSVEAGIPPQVHQLIDLLDDPAVRTWMDQQRAARNPPQTTPVDPQATLSTSTAARVALVRQHLQSLIAALPNLPGEFRQTSSVLLGELRDWGLITVVLLTTGFALLGFCLEWLFRHATARVRTRLHDSRLDTIPRAPARRHDTVRHRFRAGDRLRPGKHRSVPALRVASPAQKHRARLSGGLPLPAPVPGNRPLPSGPQGRAFPHHSGDDTPSTLLVSQAGPVRRMVRVRLHHRRTVQPPGRLKRSPPDPCLHPWSRLARHRPGKHLAQSTLIKRPAKSHQHLAALRLLRRTLAPVGRGSHAALLACDGRGRPSHGDQADATLGQPHPPPTHRSRPGPRSVLHPGHRSPQPSGRRPGTRSPRYHDHRRRHSAQLRLGHRPDRTFRPQHPADAASARRLERHRDRADRRLRVAPHQGGHRPQANPDP